MFDLLRVHNKKRSEKDLFDDDYAIFFPDFLHKGICCGYLFDLHRQVHAIQMSTHKICLYKEVDKNYTGCNPKTTKSLDCVHPAFANTVDPDQLASDLDLHCLALSM